MHADDNNDTSNKARRARGQWAGRRGRPLRRRPLTAERARGEYIKTVQVRAQWSPGTDAAQRG